jgi:hypothetical protein
VATNIPGAYAGIIRIRAAGGHRETVLDHHILNEIRGKAGIE